MAKYEAEADLTAFLYASYTYELYNNVGITFGGTLVSLSNTTKQSPRINNDVQYQEAEFFAGLVWQFSVYD